MRLPSLSPSEIAAVSAALPLISYLPAATPEQEDLNQMLLESVQFKLAAHAHSFSDNELRIFSCPSVLPSFTFKTAPNRFFPGSRRSLGLHSRPIFSR